MYTVRNPDGSWRDDEFHPGKIIHDAASNGFCVTFDPAAEVAQMTYASVTQQPPSFNIETKGVKSDNVKQKFGNVPPIALYHLAKAMSDGEQKYGRFNWREKTATASVLYNAMMRHLLAWYSGEDNAVDSGVSHIGHIMANCAILLDAKLNNTLVDDRVKGEIVSSETWEA